MLTLITTLALAAPLPESGIQYDLSLDVTPDERKLTGAGTIRWTNPSGEPVDQLPLHLFLNGYGSTETTWMLEDKGLERRAFGEAERILNDEGWGYTTLEALTGSVGDTEVAIAQAFIAPEDQNPHDRSLLQLTLDPPVAPGETLELKLEFTSTLPTMSPRTGYVEDFLVVGHALPTVALMEVTPTETGEPGPGEWQAHQYHGQTEFFVPFADYQVTVKAPEDWSIAGTGVLQEPVNEGTWKLAQPAVHDFSFVVSRGMERREAAFTRGDGSKVQVYVVYPEGFDATADRVEEIVLSGLALMDERVGPYPYDQLTAILPPEAAEGSEAVEYGTWFLGFYAQDSMQRWPGNGFRVPELVAAHELAHQYFQGVVATDEIANGWMDEGFTEYWGTRMLEATYDDGLLGSVAGFPFSLESLRAAEWLGGSENLREPMWRSPTYLYDRGQWALQLYARSSLTLRTLEGVMGREDFDRVMASWYAEQKFRHPGPEEWFNHLDTHASPEIGALARELALLDRGPNVRVSAVQSMKAKSPKGPLFGDAAPETAFDPQETDTTIQARVVSGSSATRPGGQQFLTLSKQGEAGDGKLYLSQVRLERPGLPHLPLEVELRFVDGVTVTDTWTDGALWREYVLLRPARLERASVDANGHLALDVQPWDNSKLAKLDTGAADDWAAWLGAMVGSNAHAWGWWL